MELWPDAKRAIGPAIESGFYYDFEFSSPISDDDLPRIEQKMREILKTWKEFSHREVTEKEAKALFKDNPYKLELIDEIAAKGEKLTIYTSGSYEDLCRGGHVENPSKDIASGGFKLSHLAGAYWRGDEKNKQLTRIYGLAFASKDELQDYLKMMEEAKKRDHRKLGKDLELFTLTDEVGPGLPLFYPKGAVLRRLVENFITELQERRGYEPIWIPHITKGRLYEISGHLDKYDALYPPMHLKDEADYYIKPMNCPHFMMLYKSTPHSYRELPIRWTCTTTNYRYEKSGELSGLTRVRSITQDDCHVFVRPDQIESEINLMLDMVAETYEAFGFKDFWVRISTHDPAQKEKYIGDPKVWEASEAALQKVIVKRGWKHEVGVGEAAFYGPKLDFIFKDVIGRSWQLSTIQLDMNLPGRFELEYTDADGEKKIPIV
ncbi:MAG: threonine--tRNA ligase, partial [Acidobacteria bacterium]|nr:threonine--tRNA ligase [Acidobacteriota bacterium]